MKIPKIKINWNAIFIGFLLVIIISFISFYLKRVIPQIESLQQQLATSEANLKDCNESIAKNGCKPVWSVSLQRIITKCGPETRSEALSDCSISTAKNLITKNPDSVSSKLSLNELEKFRSLLMKICMEGKGFEY